MLPLRSEQRIFGYEPVAFSTYVNLVSLDGLFSQPSFFQGPRDLCQGREFFLLVGRGFCWRVFFGLSLVWREILATGEAMPPPVVLNGEGITTSTIGIRTRLMCFFFQIDSL